MRFPRTSRQFALAFSAGLVVLALVATLHTSRP